MQTYLVGGAVRDTLLHRPVTERDWVVVGATPSQLSDKGFQQVGKDFPVFLHPKTKEEYALARTERKSGAGYTGFQCYASPDVTLEEDLRRRDLTVNAMAMASDGNIIDPFNGQQDLANRILRHVSEAFSEDPLRVFRVARFAARYHALGFTVAPETLALMTDMCNSPDIRALSQERVWKETSRSLMEDSPSVYFSILKTVGALQVWMPEFHQLESIHAVLFQLDKAASDGADLPTRWAVLCADLSYSQVQALGKQLKVPNLEQDAALIACQFVSQLTSAQTDATLLLDLLNAVDAWRRPERLTLLLNAGLYWPVKQASPLLIERFTTALNRARQIDVQSIIASGAKGPQIKSRLTELRWQSISEYLAECGGDRNN
ncbi:CCA tRNA nucleotidyltransferase [Alteromonas sp. AMM-1]|uniref:CCA tRNA nucleotidyltransferase n=1 Tax=Alteromonas sp. AMM-1 TaxID=3394233 RepID=UPI0039A69D90